MKKTLCSLFFFQLTNAFADTSSRSVNELSYNIEADLSYSNQLINPFAANAVLPANAATSKSTGSKRTLGLTKMRALLKWDLPAKSGLLMTLRPDASLDLYGNDSVKPREYDSRAGDVYVKNPKIYLLDSYQISTKLGDPFAVSAGVWDNLSNYRTAYKPILEFGLTVRFPEKFSAINANWKKSTPSAPTSAPKFSPRHDFNFYFVQGDRDRGERRANSTTTFDEAPESQDPHVGVAFTYDYEMPTGLSYGGLIGMGDQETKIRNYNSSAKTFETHEGTINEVYAHLFSSYYFSSTATTPRVSLDLRISNEKFKVDNTSIPSRRHDSLSLTASSQIASLQWALLGYHLGQSDFDKDIRAEGFQLDVGYQLRFNNQTDLLFMAAEEHRKADGAEHIGGFNNSKGNHRILRRLALTFSYELGESAND